MATRRKPRKKSKHYKSGYHASPKCSNGPAKYRSGWEKSVCEHLDSNPEVVEYQYEPFEIQYISNKKTGRIRIYIPDFLVKYNDGTQKLIEVKRKSHLNKPTVKKKTVVARAYAQSNGLIYEFWTDDKIKEIRKLLKASTGDNKTT